MHALFFLHDYLRGVNGEISEGFIYYKMGNEKRDLEPVLLKFAVPLALSIGGILYSWIMNKQSKASSSSHDSRTRSGFCFFVCLFLIMTVISSCS